MGIALMICQQLLFTADTAAIHYMSGAMSLWQIGFLRSIGGVGAALCSIPFVGVGVFRTKQIGWQAVRAAVTVAYSWILILSFARMPYAEAAALSYTQGIYIVLFAPLIGEMVGRWQYATVIIGMIGALLIVRPGFQASPLYFVVLLGTSLNAAAFVLNRFLQRRDSPVAIMFYVNAALAVMFLPGAFAPLPLAQWPWLIAIGIAGPLGMFAGIVAVRYADAATLAPYGYIRLGLAVIGGALLFGEPADGLSLLGTAGIATACVLTYRGTSAPPAPRRSDRRSGG